MSSSRSKQVIVVSATRGISTTTKIYKSPFNFYGNDSHLYVMEKNSLGLSSVYNQFLAEPRYAKSILVFVHDDVSIEDAGFVRKIRKAHESYNIVGLAGGDGAKMKQLDVPPLWHVLSATDKMSGIVAHTTGADGSVTSACFGPTPREVNMIDGLFISVDVENSKGVTFDEDFDFHLYDLAFSAKAKAAGLTIGTWPIWVIHDGIGDSFRSESWRVNAAKFNYKYRA